MDIVFRPAAPTPQDAARVLAWRNDPVTLAMFYHQEPKVFAAFWPEYLGEYFKHGDLPPLFAMVDGHEAAFLRSNPYPDGPVPGRCLDIDINVVPNRRGQGIGTAVIRAMACRLLEACQCVVAEVKCCNTPSLKAFQRAGFRVHDHATHLVAETGEIVPIVRLTAMRAQLSSLRQEDHAVL
ncbi:GNAT family N-acetyltransferase [Solidesulfovibrio magneticus]|uniref:N-acetyltransferase domain-containing protein n=1 Tax=Solidesulfovibrio magneticus (strain ATCC 700980 / DSM 13731 / RS-1) TaxID=573370 RepID=C4XTF8_SOLM1|nr:GNAT family protein [Solidesulfovibrio magneticus]BAH75955.1 hypothetical protein DMR_24640 [Solidesulfovibrio magneticus RS-1]